MEMYSALQLSLGPLSTPMFLTVCYSPYKAPRRPEDPLLAFPLNPITLACTDPNSYFAACSRPRVYFCFYWQNKFVLTRLKDRSSSKKKKINSYLSHLVSWLLACNDLQDPGSNIMIICHLTPFYTPLTQMLIFDIICFHLLWRGFKCFRKSLKTIRL